MAPRRAIAALLSGIAITDLTFRVAQVALPLVVLSATGSAAQAGLVAGAAGLPTLLSPWWARRLRDRVRSGRAIATCYLGEATGLAVVPSMVAMGHLDGRVMVVAGLLIGMCEALDGPGREALLADLGDRCRPGSAFTVLSTRDAFRRAAMVVGPVLGGVGVAAGHPVLLLWSEVLATLVAAALTVGVGSVDGPACATPSPRILTAVRERPDVLAGWVVRGTGCFCWFAFTLGLAVLGADRDQPGRYVAVAMTAYGIGSVVATPVANRLVAHCRVVLPLAAGAWAFTGGCWVAIGLLPREPVMAAASFASALAVVVGNGAITASLTRTSAGPDRLALLTGQSVVVNASSAAGLLVGGSVIALLGALPTLVTAGLTMTVVASAVALHRAGAAVEPSSTTA